MGTNPQTPAPTRLGGTASSLPPASGRGARLPYLRGRGNGAAPLRRCLGRGGGSTRPCQLMGRGSRATPSISTTVVVTDPPVAPRMGRQILRPPPAPKMGQRFGPPPPTSWTRFPPHGTGRVPAWAGGRLSAYPRPPGHPNPRQRLPHRRRHHRRHHCLSRLLNHALAASIAASSS